jgi:hypothetical protein
MTSDEKKEAIQSVLDELGLAVQEDRVCLDKMLKLTSAAMRIVAPKPEPDGEPDVEPDVAGEVNKKTEDEEKTGTEETTVTPLATLGLTEAEITKLVASENGEPSLNSVEELVAFLEDGKDLSEGKKGIGDVTEKKIVDALANLKTKA